MDAKDIIKDSVTIGQIADYYGLPDLGPCPTGHFSTGKKCFGINHRDNLYQCFNCGIFGNVISLVMLMEKMDFKDALKWLTEQYRPDLLPHIDKAKEPSPEEREQSERGILYNLVYEYGKKRLYEDPRGKSVLDYLVKERGYSLENLRQTDWIFFPREGEIRKHFAVTYPEAGKELSTRIGNLPLIGQFGDDFSRLAFPYRDRQGTITGFIKRATRKRVDGQRYDSTPGIAKADLFCIHRCKGKKDLLMVEGYPDALYLPTLGLDNIVAVGQGGFSKGYLDGLEAFGIRSVTIAFNNDEVSPGNTEKAIDLLEDAGIRVYVLDPHLIAPHKDPDEYVKGEGIEAFKSLLEKAITSPYWKRK